MSEYSNLSAEEKRKLERNWNYELQIGDEPLSERDYRIIDFALGILRPKDQDPRPAKTSLEKQRVCLLIAKKMHETGCNREAAIDQLLGDGANGLRYAFKNRVMSRETLRDYASKDPDERPEKYLEKNSLFPTSMIIESEIDEWQFYTEVKITDGTPEGW